ncbi:phosphate acyltransferase [Kingella potus]|uniref:phosphate acyltransferase n=1 Tax=Kingella potus TaxID=265175 RepID=UPI002467F01B|nr:phosphate acyltransferase [Kingella potus]
MSRLNNELADAFNARVVFAAGSGHASAERVLTAKASFAGRAVEFGGLVGAPAAVAEAAALPFLGSIEKPENTAALAAPQPVRLSPAQFRFNMMEAARKAGKRIVLPEGAEPRTVQAAAICHEKGLARCVLLAPREEVEAVAAGLGITLPESVEILNPADLVEQYVAPMCELRKSKGLTPEDARKQLQDTVVLGTMMMAQNDVDGLVSGAVHTTANTIRPALQLIKTAPAREHCVQRVLYAAAGQTVVYGDCAVNPNPNAEQLAEIAIQSVPIPPKPSASSRAWR